MTRIEWPYFQPHLIVSRVSSDSHWESGYHWCWGGLQAAGRETTPSQSTEGAGGKATTGRGEVQMLQISMCHINVCVLLNYTSSSPWMSDSGLRSSRDSRKKRDSGRSRRLERRKRKKRGRRQSAARESKRTGNKRSNAGRSSRMI